jgi:iron(III) transport system substrate-binding protein
MSKAKKGINSFAFMTVLGIILALLLAACGATATPTSAPTTAATTAAAPATTVPAATTAAIPATTAPAATTAAVRATTAPAATTAAVPATTAPATNLTGELNIYSTRREDLFQPIVEGFKAQYPNVKVNIKYGGSELNAAVVEEKGNPKADLLVGSDAAVMENLRKQEVLASSGANVERIPVEYRSSDGSWTGISGRIRIIQYNKNLVKENEAPKSIFDLADPKWKGKIGVHKSNDASLVPNVTAVRLLKGEDFTKNWLNGIVNNDTVFLNSSTDIRKAVGKGEIALGFTNHYYYHLELKDGSPVGVVYPDQGPNDLGAMLNTASVGFIKGNKNPAVAKAFIEYLISNPAQKKFAELNFEYPLVAGVETAPGVKPLREIKLMQYGGLSKLSGEEITKTRNLLNEVGWK